MTAVHDDEIADLQRANAALRLELDEQRAERDAALARETALAEVLDLINRSPGDPTPVFEAILRNAHELCGVELGALVVVEGDDARAVAVQGYSPNLDAMLRQSRPAQAHVRELAGSERHIHLPDVQIVTPDPNDVVLRTLIEQTGAHTRLVVPLRIESALGGFITAMRLEVRPFSRSEIALLGQFAAQAVIAIEHTRLLTELQQRNAEFGERIEQQAATIDVLRAMSASPGNPQPVFDLIVHRASELCNAPTTGLLQFDGEFVHLRSVAYAEGALDREGYEAYKRLFPMVPTRGSLSCRAILDRQIIHVRDLPSEPGVMPAVRQMGHRSQLSLPLIRDGAGIGAIVLVALEPGGFSDSQVALLQTFAEQAVIAITSAETYRALQERTAALAARNSEYSERIAQQSATIDILKAMSASPGDPQPVFDLIVHQARRLLTSRNVVLFDYDGALVRIRADAGTEEFVAGSFARYKSAFPMKPNPDSLTSRAILTGQIVHVLDVQEDPSISELVRGLGHKSQLSVPLRRDGVSIGAISTGLDTTGGFSDSQVALLQTFAEQAVIAITSAETYRALQARTGELQQSLEYQTATNDVLKVISRSSFDLEPVFQVVVDTATRLCRADQAAIYRLRDGAYRWAGSCSNTPEYERIERELAILPGPGTLVGRVARDGCAVEIPDAWTDPLYEAKDDARVGGIHTLLGVPLMRDGEAIGVIGLARRRIEPYTKAQIELVSTFANQAVIAIENTRLLTEQREALEQQTATAEVLQVINANPGNLEPVFDALLEKALRLCEAAFGNLLRYDPPFMHFLAARHLPGKVPLSGRSWVPEPGSATEQVVQGTDVVHIVDVADSDAYRFKLPSRVDLVERMGGRTALWVALRKDEALLGVLVVYRREVRPFTDKQIALLQNFAAQAVIAMENARLLDEIRRRQEELRITFENMGDGVAMFDETPRLVAWNRKFQEILDVPDGVLDEQRTYEEYIRYLTERGEFGPNADPEAQIRRLQAIRNQTTVFERTRPNGRVIEVRHNPVPGGGFVLIYADITDRKRSEAELRAARDAAEEASRTLETAYRDLKAAQASLIQAEKMASLGQLTAGIAHEIKNPLNFVNNFASLSVDLMAELKDAAAPGFAALPEDRRADVEEVSGLLTSNLQKIVEHGQRADGIVKSMLLHSRGASGERRMVDLNTLIDEALNLAYHGARAQDQSFNVKLERDFGAGIAPIELAPQEMTRVFLNLFSNGFYATRKRAQVDTAVFEPTVKVTTRDLGDAVEVQVRDNGTGIPADTKDKLFQPFFTTKPTGEGTGLGLSISYDIVAQQHGGAITVESEPGAFTEFTIRLPRLPAAIRERASA